MRTLLKTEEVGLFLLSVYLFSRMDLAWWVYLALLLAPDLGMLGYLFGPRIGSIAYNTTHHKGLAGLFYIVGMILPAPWLALAGVILLGHSSLDRALGYGLKYGDSFHHTHLGWIGGRKTTMPQPE